MFSSFFGGKAMERSLCSGDDSEIMDLYLLAEEEQIQLKRLNDAV